MSCFITYGPISIERVIIRAVKCTSVMSEDGITLRYFRHEIDFAGYCSPVENQHYIYDRNFKPARGGNTPAFSSAMTISQWLAVPKQYFRMEFNKSVYLETPPNGFQTHLTADAEMGPKCINIRVTNVNGEVGYAGTDQGGGHCMVSGTFIVCKDGLAGIGLGSTDGGGWLQGYAMSRTHEIDGDSLQTSIMTQITVYGRPEALYSIQAQATNDRYIERHFGPIAPLLTVIPGFKRKRSRIEVEATGTKANIILIDEQRIMPLGSLSPSYFFEPSTTHVFRWSGSNNRDGAPHNALVLNINAVAPKTVTRERVIQQMLFWLSVKGQGGDGPGAPNRRGNFLFYQEVTLNIDYASNKLQLNAKIVTLPNTVGPSGIPMNMTTGRLNASQDYADVDDATRLWRDNGNNEPKQGTERNIALSPAMQENYRGSWVGNILTNFTGLEAPFNNRILPDGRAYYCEEPQPTVGVADVKPRNESEATFTDGDIFSVAIVDAELPGVDLSYRNLNDFGYESVWMQTRYDTEKGTMVLPTGGVMPGTSPGDEDLVAERVQVDVHQGITRKVVHWGVMGVGYQPPTYPDPVVSTDTTKDILIKSVIQPAAPVPIGPLLYAWTVTGTYYYDCLVIKQPGNTLSTGKLPNTSQPATDYNIPGANSASGFII